MLILRTLPILLLIVVIGGCSRTELLYKNASWLAYRWTSKLVDTNADQKRPWQARFDQVMVEHQEQLLPKVIVLLDALTDQTQTGLTVDGLSCLAEAAERLYRAHARLAVPLGSQVLGDLSSEQVTHLAGKLDERNLEYISDYLQEDQEQRQRDRLSRYVKRIERWTGDLSKAQRAIVQQSLTKMPKSAADWLAYRRQQQERLILMLQRGSDRVELEKFLSAWWVDFADRPAHFVTKNQRSKDLSISMIVKLYAALDNDQRTTLRGRVGEIRDALRGLDETRHGLAARPATLSCG